MPKLQWVPLECNPDVFNEWATGLGLKPSEGSFCDIYGLDPELLASIPRPVYAVIMLFPTNTAWEKHTQDRDASVKSDGSEHGLLWFKQTIGNACGTMAAIHASTNTPLHFDDDSSMAKTIKDCKNKTPDERAAYLESWSDLESVHTKVAQGGQSRAPPCDAEVDDHYSCFVPANFDGKSHLVELDGIRGGPIDHGEIKGDFLEAVADAVRGYIEITNSIHFTLVALIGPQAP